MKACLYVSGEVDKRAYVRASVCACVRACVCACMCTSVRKCVRARFIFNLLMEISPQDLSFDVNPMNH